MPNLKWIAAYLAILIGIAVHVITMLLFTLNNGSITPISNWLWFTYPAFLPYIAAAIISAIAREPILTLCSITLPLVIDLFLFVNTVLLPNDGFAGVVWYFAHWWNLLLFLPAGFAVGLWRLRRQEDASF